MQAYSDEHNLITIGSTIIIGLSGGPDSVALLSILKKLQPQYNLTLIAAHLDHQWRKDSHKDEAFCKELAASHNIEYVSTKAEDITLPSSKMKNPSSAPKEEVGRALRRAFFNDLAHKHNATAIALGHHYNDQQETFFLRMIRGASIAGLAAMKPKQEIYIRPLLTCTKQEIIEYLASEGLKYLEDETNKDTHYLRNAIRHLVIPALRDCDTRFDVSFSKTFSNVQQTDAYLDRVTKTAFDHITSKQSNVLALDKDKFLAIDSFLHHRLLVLWLCKEGVPFTPTTSFFNEIMRFMNNSGKEHKVHTSWSIIKNAHQIRINHQKD